MEVVGIFRNGISFRNIVEGGISRRGYLNRFTEGLSLLEGLLSPYTSVKISCLLHQEVVGHHSEMHAGTTTEEEYGVTLGNVENLLEEGYRLIDYRLEIL